MKSIPTKAVEGAASFSGCLREKPWDTPALGYYIFLLILSFSLDSSILLDSRSNLGTVFQAGHNGVETLPPDKQDSVPNELQYLLGKYNTSYGLKFVGKSVNYWYWKNQRKYFHCSDIQVALKVLHSAKITS